MSTTFLSAPATTGGTPRDIFSTPPTPGAPAEHRPHHQGHHIAFGDVHDAKSETLCVGESR